MLTGGMAGRGRLSPERVSFKLPDKMTLEAARESCSTTSTVYFARKVRGRLQAGETRAGARGGRRDRQYRRCAPAPGVSHRRGGQHAEKAELDSGRGDRWCWPRVRATRYRSRRTAVVSIIVDPVGGDRATDRAALACCGGRRWSSAGGEIPP